MDVLLKDVLPQDDARRAASRSYRVALSALSDLPDRCATDVGELAARIGADKLDLLQWGRADISFARLVASKMTT